MRLLLIIALFAIPSITFAQTLESQVRPDGIIFPRMTTVERDLSIPLPEIGQCIYNTDRSKIECYDGQSWEKTSYYSLSGSAFHPDNDDNNTQWIAGENGAYFFTAPLAFRGMVAGVNLPHQSKVVSITIFYEDLDMSNSCLFSLTHNNSFMANVVQIDAATSSTNTVGGMPGTVTIPTDITIDNLEKAYHFTMRPNVANTLSSNFKLFKVVFEYVEDAGDTGMPPAIHLSDHYENSAPGSSDYSKQILLYPNQPNPFSESTLIRYYIPEGSTKAELRITNLEGKVIKAIPIQDTGEGQLTVNAHSLSAGTYLYSLLVDGELIATEKMILTGTK